MSEHGIYDYLNKEAHKNSPVIEADLAKAIDHILGLNTPWWVTYKKMLSGRMNEFQE